MMTVRELRLALASVPDETQIACEMDDGELVGRVLSVELTDGVFTIFAEENLDDEDDEGDEEEDEEPETDPPPTGE